MAAPQIKQPNIRPAHRIAGEPLEAGRPVREQQDKDKVRVYMRNRAAPAGTKGRGAQVTYTLARDYREDEVIDEADIVLGDNAAPDK